MKSFLEHIKDNVQSYFSIVGEFDTLLGETHQKITLGISNGMPIYFWLAPNSRYLISSGWQGKEEAGIFASYHLAKEKFVESCSFLPIACPSCLLSRSSKNHQGISADRHFKNSDSEETQAIKEKIDLLYKSARSGHFALHEDPNRSFPYYYIWGEMNLEVIENTFNKYFEKTHRDLKYSPNGEGMFCDYLYKQGIPFSIQLETPADGTCDLEKRSECLHAIVKDYIRYLESIPH